MLLRSLFEDEGTLTLDCVKAKMQKGDTIEVPDVCWHQPEIQGALKLKMIEVVGQAPNVPKPETKKVVEEEKKKFVSAANTKLAFDCIKDYVEPGGTILIPLSKISEVEVQNALGWGLLVDPDAKAAPKAKQKTRSAPAVLEEAKLPTEKKKPSKHAKSIKRVEAEESGSDDALDSMFRPSEVIDPAPSAKASPAKELPKAKASMQGGMAEIFGLETDNAKASAAASEEEI